MTDPRYLACDEAMALDDLLVRAFVLDSAMDPAKRELLVLQASEALQEALVDRAEKFLADDATQRAIQRMLGGGRTESAPVATGFGGLQRKR